MKRKRLFSALMALAMILSLCTFASASGTTPTTVALAPGSAKLGANASALADDEHLTVSGIGDKEHQTVPAELAEAVISYAVTVQVTAASGTSPESRTASPAASQNMSITLKGETSASTTYTVAVKSDDTLDLAGTTPADIQISDNSNVVATVTVTPDGQAPLVLAAANNDTLAGTITLGAAGAFAPDPLPEKTDGQFNNYTKYTVSGEVTNEGPLPDDVINVKVPTDAQTKNAFDLYLDPHDLIKDSVTKRYTGITASGTGRLYFKDSATTMSDSSAALTIVNKSNVQVNVDLSVEATKGANDFTFVDTAAGVDSATGAAIYLALKSGTTETAISDTANASGKNTAKIETSIDTDESWYDLNWHGPEKLGYYSYDMTSTLANSTNDADFKSITFSLTGAINENDAWDEIDNFGLSVIWEIKAYEAPEEPSATVTTPFSGAGSTLSINLTWGTLTSAKTKAKITINNADTVVTAPNTTMTVTAPVNNTIYGNIPSTATVTFYTDTADEVGAIPKTVTIK